MAVLSAGVAASLLPGCNSTPPEKPAAMPSGEDAAKVVLDGIGERLLALAPETATTLGLDSGGRAALRSKLADRSRAGQDAIAAQLRADLAQAEAIDTRGLPSHATRTTVEVVKSAYRIALDGFALPYGDVAVGGWRNTPYVVIQNVGAYLDTPRFLDADHPVKTAADADAYLARLESYAQQLDGELARLQAAGAMGLVAPAFLLDKAIEQIGISLASAQKGGGLMESLVRRTKDVPGTGARAPRRWLATRWRRPWPVSWPSSGAARQGHDGRRHVGPAAWRRVLPWALRASTTTRMTPDEVHQLGQEQVRGSARARWTRS